MNDVCKVCTQSSVRLQVYIRVSGVEVLGEEKERNKNEEGKNVCIMK